MGSYLTTEAVTERCSVKKVFLKISKSSQENTCARVSFLIKLQAISIPPENIRNGLQLYLKRDSGKGAYVNYVKFLRTPFSTEHLRWLFL